MIFQVNRLGKEVPAKYNFVEKEVKPSTAIIGKMYSSAAKLLPPLPYRDPQEITLSKLHSLKIYALSAVFTF